MELAQSSYHLSTILSSIYSLHDLLVHRVVQNKNIATVARKGRMQKRDSEQGRTPTTQTWLFILVCYLTTYKEK